MASMMFKPSGESKLRWAGAAAGLLLLIAGPTAASAQSLACALGPAEAARANSQSLSSLAFTPFGRVEIGWETYGPLIQAEIKSNCPVTSPGFAAALARWQGRSPPPASGRVDAATFEKIKAAVHARRPFVIGSRAGCPLPIPETLLVKGAAKEGYGGKVVILQAEPLRAYREMVAAARSELKGMKADPRLLTIFSSYRNPDADAVRCLRDGNCDNVRRSACSPHRSGYAVDLYLGQAPGFGPDSSVDANRLFISRGETYRWLVRNGLRFGFYNYTFEPWHWEWGPKSGL